MKKLIRFIPLLITPLMLTSCKLPFFPANKSSVSSEPDTFPEGKKGTWTIMIYMCGSDLESGWDGEKSNPGFAGLATLDIEEILSVTGQTDNVNIIIETGGAYAWNPKYGISSDKLGRYHVKNNKLIKDEELEYASMGSTSTFESFLRWGLYNYPAEKTGVVLWNHGGAMSGVCFDEKEKNDSLLNSETKGVFSKVLKDRKLEFIGYDACLMGMQDIAVTNSEFFNYMVCAQESEIGEGWNYDTWVDDLYAGKDTETILKAIAQGLIDDFEASYGEWYDNEQTVSVLDLSKMDDYKQTIENVAEDVSHGIKLYGKSKFYKWARRNIKNFGTTVYSSAEELMEATGLTPLEASRYGIDNIDGKYYEWGSNYFGTFDAYDFFTKISDISFFSSLTSELSNIQAAVEDVVIYNAIGKDAGEAHGISLFYPTSGSANKEAYYTLQQTSFSGWQTMVSETGA